MAISHEWNRFPRYLDSGANTLTLLNKPAAAGAAGAFSIYLRQSIF
jgi:hypothetical protein